MFTCVCRLNCLVLCVHQAEVCLVHPELMKRCPLCTTHPSPRWQETQPETLSSSKPARRPQVMQGLAKERPMRQRCLFSQMSDHKIRISIRFDIFQLYAPPKYGISRNIKDDRDKHKWKLLFFLMLSRITATVHEHCCDSQFYFSHK